MAEYDAAGWTEAVANTPVVAVSASSPSVCHDVPVDNISRLAASARTSSMLDLCVKEVLYEGGAGEEGGIARGIGKGAVGAEGRGDLVRGSTVFVEGPGVAGDTAALGVAPGADNGVAAEIGAGETSATVPEPPNPKLWRADVTSAEEPATGVASTADGDVAPKVGRDVERTTLIEASVAVAAAVAFTSVSTES